MRHGRTHRRRQRRKQQQQHNHHNHHHHNHHHQHGAGTSSRGRPCTDSAWAELRGWCKARGMAKTKLTLAYFPDTFRGMMATRDIGRGEDVIRVPEQLLMTASKVRRHTTHQAAAACGGSALRWTLSEHQSLAYWLCGEAGRRAASEWASYVGSLPRDFGSVPLYALSGEGPSSGVAAGSPEARWVAAHLPQPMRLRLAAQQARLFADWSATAAFLAAAGLAPLRGWRLYVWAWLAVNTR
ncbi:hypothetical protein LPJ66_010957, partial [Kickxella alabastrina]